MADRKLGHFRTLTMGNGAMMTAFANINDETKNAFASGDWIAKHIVHKQLNYYYKARIYSLSSNVKVKKE